MAGNVEYQRHMKRSIAAALAKEMQGTLTTLGLNSQTGMCSCAGTKWEPDDVQW